MNIKEITDRLKQPVPKSYLSTKTLKGNKISYIAWYDICELLDERCGSDRWEWRVGEVKAIGKSVSLVGTLTIRGDDLTMTKQSTGIEDLDCSSYGDPSSNAEAMALRRAAAKFGLARDLWRKTPAPSYSQTQEQRRTTPTLSKSAPRNTVPTSSSKGQISREEWLKRKASQA